MTIKISKIASILELKNQEKHWIDQRQWVFKKKPNSYLQLAIYQKEAIAIRLMTDVKNPLVRYQHDQDPVYKDDALEFFISFDQKTYFNFEMNKNGAILAAYGTKKDREKLPDLCLVHREQVEDFDYWGLELLLPFDLFLAKEIDLNFSEFYINAYKISEDKEHEHYVSLSKLNSSKPDFHRPEDFIMVRVE